MLMPSHVALMATSRARRAENRPSKRLARQRHRWLNLAAIMAQFLTAVDIADECQKATVFLFGRFSIEGGDCFVHQLIPFPNLLGDLCGDGTATSGIAPNCVPSSVKSSGNPMLPIRPAAEYPLSRFLRTLPDSSSAMEHCQEM